jgi:hypothetical protein
LANELNDDFRERGLTLVHVLLDGPTGDPATWEDAHNWAYEFDHDETGPYQPPLKNLVIADTDRGIWNAYKENCGSDLFCQLTCHVTPQHQLLDPGLVTVDDPCALNGGTTCDGCGYDDATVRAHLDATLPPKWCGQADE